MTTTKTDPVDTNKVMFIARPKWWNLVGRYRWWKVLRDIKAGIYECRYYVPGEDNDHN